MNEEKRMNGGYEIIESCQIGRTELVIGHNSKAPNPYVCWYYKEGTVIFCDVCMQKILDRKKEKQRQEDGNE